jgi:hypothetical protein
MKSPLTPPSMPNAALNAAKAEQDYLLTLDPATAKATCLFIGSVLTAQYCKDWNVPFAAQQTRLCSDSFNKKSHLLSGRSKQRERLALETGVRPLNEEVDALREALYTNAKTVTVEQVNEYNAASAKLKAAKKELASAMEPYIEETEAAAYVLADDLKRKLIDHLYGTRIALIKEPATPAADWESYL